MVKIAPSLLSADFGRLNEEVKNLEKAGADILHLDIMDGHFVPNLTFGPMVVKHLRPHSKLVFDTHLMVSNPKDLIPLFADAGSDVITIHFEACENLRQMLTLIKSFGKKAGVSINPATSEDVLKPYLDSIDLILVMTVNPGWGGQKFMPEQLDKIKNIKKMIGNQDITLEVDGGITQENAHLCIAAGADVLVAGTAVFKGGNYKENIANLR